MGLGGKNRWFNMQAPLDSSIVYSQKYESNLAVNLFPLAAYQKIYQDFFRWSQWENADPTSYNFDWFNGTGSIFPSGISSSIPANNPYWKRDNLFSLRYANWNKDKFMGLLPSSQFGDVAVIDLSGSGSEIPDYSHVLFVDESNSSNNRPVETNETISNDPSSTTTLRQGLSGSSLRIIS